jgi:hypothetical protein
VPEFSDLHQVAGASHEGAMEDSAAAGDSDTNRLVTTGTQEEVRGLGPGLGGHEGREDSGIVTPTGSSPQAHRRR